MEDSDRKIISDNKERLIKTTSYSMLMELCLDYKILTETMKQNIEKVAIRESVRHEMLFEKIIHRGPTAFSRLLLICNDHFKDAYNILAEEEIYSGPFKSLKKKTNSEHTTINRSTTTSLSLYENTISNLFEIKRCENFSSSHIQQYDMTSKSRGVFVLVNIINDRPKAQLEAEYLIHLFRGLGFKIFYHEDLQMDDLDRFIKDLTVSSHFYHIDSFAFALLANSTGQHNNFVQLIDKYRDIEYFIMKFNNKNCPQLIDRPKIFMFPKYNSKPYSKTYTETDGAPKMHLRIEREENISTVSDVLYFFLEYDKGKKSFLDYIRVMCEVWSKHAHELHVQELIKLVNTQTFQCGQTHHRDTVDYGFTKNLYFNPGIYLENNVKMNFD